VRCCRQVQLDREMPIDGSASNQTFLADYALFGGWAGAMESLVNGLAAEVRCANANKGAADIVAITLARRGRNVVYCLSAAPCPNWIPLGRISHQRRAVRPGRQKGGALAPPQSGASLLVFPRLPRSLRRQAAREARERINEWAL
jgi:hypothetical protein